MTLLPTNTPLGDLSMLDIFEYVDAPRLFSARNRSGQLYLAVWLGEEGEADSWLYAPMSVDRFKDVRRGHVSLHDAFSRTEDGLAFLVAIDRASGLARHETRRARDLAEDQLPLPSARLRLDEEQTEEPDALPARREVLDVALQPPRSQVHEAPAGLVGAVLAALQELVDALAHAMVPESSDRAPTPHWLREQTELAVVKTFGGSLGVRLASASPLALFGDDAVSGAIESLLKLLEAGDDRAKLRGLLRVYRSKAARRYGALLAQLAEGDADLVAKWPTAKGERRREAGITSKAASRALAMLREIEEQTPSDFRVTGTLTGINVDRVTFALRTDADERYSGRILESAAAALHAKMSDRYSALLREHVEVEPSTGRTRSRFELVEIRHLGK